jgi:conjugal transfer pilus assembly protein TraV
MKPGVRCESLDQVNAQVDHGEIGQNYSKKIAVIYSYNEKTIPSYSTYQPRSSLQKKPLRYGETIMRVWIAPYEDTDQNYHQESNIYTIVKSGHWISYPPKASSIED